MDEGTGFYHPFSGALRSRQSFCLCQFVCFLSVFSRFQLLKMHLQVKSSVSVLVSIPLLLQQPSKSSFEAALKLGQSVFSKVAHSFFAVGPGALPAFIPCPSRPLPRRAAGVVLKAGTWWEQCSHVQKKQNINLMGSNLDSCQFFYVSL